MTFSSSLCCIVSCVTNCLPLYVRRVIYLPFSYVNYISMTFDCVIFIELLLFFHALFFNFTFIVIYKCLMLIILSHSLIVIVVTCFYVDALHSPVYMRWFFRNAPILLIKTFFLLLSPNPSPHGHSLHSSILWLTHCDTFLSYCRHSVIKEVDDESIELEWIAYPSHHINRYMCYKRPMCYCVSICVWRVLT